jgi:hypothetical protein
VVCEVVFVGMEPNLELIGNRLAVDFVEQRVQFVSDEISRIDIRGVRYVF